MAAGDPQAGGPADRQGLVHLGMVDAELGEGPGGADLLVGAVADVGIEANRARLRTGPAQALQAVQAAHGDQHALADGLGHFPVGHVVFRVGDPLRGDADFQGHGDFTGADRIDAETFANDGFHHRRAGVGLNREQGLERLPGNGGF